MKKEFTYKQSLFSSGYPAFQRDARFETQQIMNRLDRYKNEMEVELQRILEWWIKIAIDEKHGGFYGKIDHSNNVSARAPKGAVLNCRILWAFSSAFNLTAEKKYLETADRAFAYIAQHFMDDQFGGMFWTVDFEGRPLDTKKQIYALAFAVYGLSEYYRVSQNEKAIILAIELYHVIVKYSYDDAYGGYIEAFTREWKEAEDLRLSTKDANEKKSMNTHLHLLEAFTNLYKTWKDASLGRRLAELVNIFLHHIIDKQTNHLILFFDDTWQARSRVISFGHDIESAWLLYEAADLLEDESLMNEVEKNSTRITEAAAEGIDNDGGLWYEYDSNARQLIKQKHSWPQAEAMIGFFNAWQITGEEKFLEQSIKTWDFVKSFMLDKDLGEWYWGVNEDHSPMLSEDKAGIWKCPYHNSRACIEIIRRIQSLSKTV